MVMDDIIFNDLENDFRIACSESLQALVECCQQSIIPTTFFVGAGVSVLQPSGMPTAKEILQWFFSYCKQCWPDITDEVQLILDAIDSNQAPPMENVFQHLYEVIRPSPFHVARIFDVPPDSSRFNLNHEFLARWIQGQRGGVITTNLDSLIEQAWHITFPTEERVLSINKPEEFDRSIIDSWPWPPAVWKLHGSCEDSASWGVTLGKVAFELQDGRADLLRHVISRHNLCFVGWQATDLDISPLVERTLAQSNSANRVFWIFRGHKGLRHVDDYLARVPDVRRLFKASRRPILPIVSTAEDLFTCLLDSLFNVLREAEAGSHKHETDYAWLAHDIHTADDLGIHKLIGFVLRNIGRYEASIRLLDRTSERAIIQAAQLLQESAHTCWQINRVPEARERVDKACRLLEQVNSPLDRLWGQYGRVTMALDGKSQVSLWQKAIAIPSLYRLRFQFRGLARGSRVAKSARAGAALCSFYELKILEKLVPVRWLIHIKVFRRWLLQRYELVAADIQQDEQAHALIDVLQRQAFVLVYDDRKRAGEVMMIAVRLAKSVGHRYYLRTLDKMLSLAQLSNDLALIEWTIEEKRKALGTSTSLSDAK